MIIRHLRVVYIAFAGISIFSCGQNQGVPAHLRAILPQLQGDATSITAPTRPNPDSRGIIFLANARLILAQKDDSPAKIAMRLNLSKTELARYNALPVDAPLAQGSVLVLPTSANAPQSAPNLIKIQQHIPQTGETAWSIARRFGISVQDLAQWNSLPVTMTLRPGQRLVIPPSLLSSKQDQTQSALRTIPGQGSPTPVPPSAKKPLPDEKTPPPATNIAQPPAIDLGVTRTASSKNGVFQMPVNGPIIRLYSKGRNDGIDIATTAKAPIMAAAQGRVNAIAQDEDGTTLIVLAHPDNLLSIYTGLSSVKVTQGSPIARGQILGNAGNAGFVHFEIRRNLESLDPETVLK